VTDTADGKDGTARPAEGGDLSPAQGGDPIPQPRDVSPDEHEDLSQDERDELEKLRKQVTELRTKPSWWRPRRRVSWRTPVSILLIAIGCILAPEAVIGVWTANQVSDTNRYVANMTPLIHDPAIQAALTDKISNQINAQIDVPALAKQAATQLNQKGLTRVATLVQNFSGSIASAVQGFIHSAVARVVASPAMARAWVAVNTIGHQALVKALSGRGNGTVTVSNGQVVLNLGPLINVAKQNLVASGLTIAGKIPAVNATFPLFPSKNLVKAQKAYRVINDLKIILPILVLLFIAGGVYIARGHRRALIGAGLGFAASMLILGITLLIVRGQYLNAIPPATLPTDAAAAAFDILVRFIREALRALLIVGLVVALGAFITGPSVTAVRIRRSLVSAFNWIRRSGESRGVSTGPVGEWTYAHRRALRTSVVGVLALIFVFIGHPSVAEVIWILVILVVLLGLIELIGRPPAPGAAPESSEASEAPKASEVSATQR
jgi:hypothetical protein